MVMLAAVLASATGTVSAQPQEPRTIFFEVRLPADAVLLIDGYKTKSTGDTRIFETPAVPPGKTYTYTLKAIVGTREVSKKILLKVGERGAIDLRGDFAKAMPKPEPKEDKFVLIPEGGAVWVFKKGSTALAAFQKEGPPARHVLRLKAGPNGATLKAPDGATIEEYLKK
jgi:uncharacterized protein (TIGR03000 family)